MNRRWPILAICLAAFGLMTVGLSTAPPGLTHDEAAHGWEALQLLDGSWRYYFPLGYGREPLYAYLLAGTMSATGVGIFSLRLVIPWAMTLALAATFILSSKLFNRPTALLTASVWAVGFWPLAVGRQALRHGLVPLFIVAGGIGVAMAIHPDRWRIRRSIWPIILIGASIGLMLHTYIAARVLWTIPLVFVVALWVIDRPVARRATKPILLGIGLGLLIGAPLMIYLRLNPGLESRLDMLSRPLTALLDGNIRPLFNNSWAALQALVWPGRGDSFLAYNIPGRPTLEVVSSGLAVIGLGIAVWRWKRPEHLFLLIWLLVGLSPALITGPTASTTRNIGALPALYMIVGIGGWGLLRLLGRETWRGAITLVLLTAIAWQTGRDYYIEWLRSPDVRAAYQSTIIASLDYVDQTFPVFQPVAISSVFPGPAHDPLIADLVFANTDRPIRWVDSRRAVIVPASREIFQIAPASADLHPLFASWATPIDQTSMRRSDLDPYYTEYLLSIPPSEGTVEPIIFEDWLSLEDVRWLGEDVPPGGVGELLTVWHVRETGPLARVDSPLDGPDLAIFLHVLDENGEIFAQDDRLDASLHTWEAGDRIYQIHQVTIPPETAVGPYSVRLGIYDRITLTRLRTSVGEEFLMGPELLVQTP